MSDLLRGADRPACNLYQAQVATAKNTRHAQPPGFVPDSRLGRPLGSGSGRSTQRAELTLIGSKQTVIQATNETLNVSNALSSGHQRCHVAGSP